MSISYSADLVCGFKVEVRKERTAQKKFNENTGEPYEVMVPSHDVALVGAVEVATTKGNPDAFCNGEEVDGLEFGESGYESGTKWLGKVVAEVDDYKDDFKEFVPDVPAEVQAFAEKRGLTPKWFLSLSCG
jgi:hypothetical protein